MNRFIVFINILLIPIFVFSFPHTLKKLKNVKDIEWLVSDKHCSYYKITPKYMSPYILRLFPNGKTTIWKINDGEFPNIIGKPIPRNKDRIDFYAINSKNKILFTFKSDSNDSEEGKVIKSSSNDLIINEYGYPIELNEPQKYISTITDEEQKLMIRTFLTNDNKTFLHFYALEHNKPLEKKCLGIIELQYKIKPVYLSVQKKILIFYRYDHGVYMFYNLNFDGNNIYLYPSNRENIFSKEDDFISELIDDQPNDISFYHADEEGNKKRLNRIIIRGKKILVKQIADKPVDRLDYFYTQNPKAYQPFVLYPTERIKWVACYLSNKVLWCMTFPEYFQLSFTNYIPKNKIGKDFELQDVRLNKYTGNVLFILLNNKTSEAIIIERNFSKASVFVLGNRKINKVHNAAKELKYNHYLNKQIAWGSATLPDKRKLACYWINGTPYSIAKLDPKENKNIVFSEITGKYSCEDYLLFCGNYKRDDGIKSSFIFIIRHENDNEYRVKHAYYKLGGLSPTVFGINNSAIFGCNETKENTLPCYWAPKIYVNDNNKLRVMMSKPVIIQVENLKNAETFIPISYNGNEFICSYYMNKRKAEVLLPTIRPVLITNNGKLCPLPIPANKDYQYCIANCRNGNYIGGQINGSPVIWKKDKDKWQLIIISPNFQAKENKDLKAFNRYSPEKEGITSINLGEKIELIGSYKGQPFIAFLNENNICNVHVWDKGLKELVCKSSFDPKNCKRIISLDTSNLVVEAIDQSGNTIVQEVTKPDLSK